MVNLLDSLLHPYGPDGPQVFRASNGLKVTLCFYLCSYSNTSSRDADKFYHFNGVPSLYIKEQSFIQLSWPAVLN